MYVMPTSKLERTIKENGTPEGLLDGLLECISILKTHDRDELERVVKELKQKDGESWAVGEMLQRVIYFLGNTGGFVQDTKKVKIQKMGVEYTDKEGVKPYLRVVTNDPVKGVTQSLDVLVSEVEDMLKKGVTHVIIKEPVRYRKEFVKPVYGD